MSQSPSPLVTFTLEPARERRSLADEWRALELHADASFFQSWSWIGAWLAELPDAYDPVCLTARDGKEIVGLAILTPCHTFRRGFVSSRQLHLHTTGDRNRDRLTIEYNGILTHRRVAGTLNTDCLRYLRAQENLWDEIYLDGVNIAWCALAESAAGNVLVRQKSPCPFVDLAALEDRDYLAELSPNTRHQIRRAHRRYGNVHVDVAHTIESARATWRDMKELHQAYWHGRAQTGAFDNPVFEAFHQRLIAERLASDEIQLLRVTGDLGLIGCLYNFVHRGRVYAYQSGFVYSNDNRLKPGLVSHHAAIELNRTLGHRYYDFLAGEARYKRSLAKEANQLVWIVVQRPRIAFALENFLRRLKRPFRWLSGTTERQIHDEP